MDTVGDRATGTVRSRSGPVRIAAVVLGVVLVMASVVALLLVAYTDAVERVHAHASEEITATGRTRASIIENWWTERMVDASAITDSAAFRADVVRLLERDGDWTYAEARVDAVEALDMLHPPGAYAAGLLLDRDGALLLASGRSDAEIAPETLESVRRVATLGRAEIGRPWASQRDGRTHLDLTIPVTDDGGRVRAVVVSRIDPDQELYDAVLGVGEPHEQGRVRLLDPAVDGLVEVTPGAIAGGALAVTPWDSPLGREVLRTLFRRDRHSTRRTDADGAGVLVDIRPVAGSPWVVVVEADALDAENLARETGLQAAGRVVLAVLVVGLFITGTLLVRQRRMLRDLARAEQDRSLASSRVDEVLAHARDIVLLLDERGSILDANASALAAYGYSLDELRAMHLADLRAPDERWSVARDLRTATTPGGAHWQSIHQRRDGSTFPVETTAHVIRIEDVVRTEVVVRDIKDRYEAAEAMRQQLDELRRWQAGAIGREERILELKAEVNQLLEDQGRPARYASIDQVARVGRGA